MRTTRLIPFLFALAAVAMSVAGCAEQPALFDMAYAPPAASTRAAVAPAPAPAPGIDNTFYGYAAPPPRPRRVAAATPSAGRGLFTSGSLFTTGGSSAPAPAPAADRDVAVTGDILPDPAPRLAPAPVTSVTYAPPPTSRPYTLDSGDRLRVVVFGQDGLSNSYVVDASGYIDMPLIGTVLARGATTDDLSRRIADKLRQGYVKDPHVAVEVEAYRPFFILGEVTQPGQYPYVADMTAETAVAIAGGFSPRAYRRKVTITRLVDGRQVRMQVPPSYPIRPGDTINVQERWF